MAPIGDRLVRRFLGTSLCNGVSTMPGATVLTRIVSSHIPCKAPRGRVNAALGHHRHRCVEACDRMIDQDVVMLTMLPPDFCASICTDRKLSEMDEAVEVVDDSFLKSSTV